MKIAILFFEFVNFVDHWVVGLEWLSKVVWIKEYTEMDIGDFLFVDFVVTL